MQNAHQRSKHSRFFSRIPWNRWSSEIQDSKYRIRATETPALTFPRSSGMIGVRYNPKFTFTSRCEQFLRFPWIVDSLFGANDAAEQSLWQDFDGKECSNGSETTINRFSSSFCALAGPVTFLWGHPEFLDGGSQNSTKCRILAKTTPQLFPMTL